MKKILKRLIASIFPRVRRKVMNLTSLMTVTLKYLTKNMI
jgi:hypothetical protein